MTMIKLSAVKHTLASLGVATATFMPMAAQAKYTPEVDNKADSLLSLMTTDEKLLMIGGVDWMYTRDSDRLGIPRMKMTDGPQGLGTHGKSTAYPATVMLAATWNEDLAKEYGQALGNDCRARGVDILLGPAVNIYRAPMCGRNFEYMGEDPYLAGKTAAGYIKGVQSKNVMATIKHFIGNNSDYDRDNISNDMDERTMHEIYLPAFKAAVQEGETGALMTSYNLVNGIYTTENPYLLKDILRDRWSFKGLVMSDWGSTHHCIPAASSGLDLEMAGGEKMNPKDMSYYLTTGHVTMEMVDEKVRNILRTMIAFGFDKPRQADNSIALDNPVSAATALKVAREGAVLLKNEKNILPINPKKTKRISVVGKNALGYIYGGGSGKVTPFHYVDFYNGIASEAKRHGIEVEYVDQLDFMPAIIFTDRNATQQGFKSEYYPNMHLKGTPLHQAAEKHISHSWSGGTGIKGMPDGNYSVRWRAFIKPDKTADYTFTLAADDGCRMILDGETVIDDWHEGGFRGTDATRRLEAGKTYPIIVEYFQKGGGAGVKLEWKMEGDETGKMVKHLDKSDLIIACIGHSADSEAEGSDRTFELPGSDANLMATLTGCRKPVIAVVNAGGNVEMQSWEPQIKGLLWAWYAGQEGGTAIADILFGNVNPSGKLPMTFEKRWADNPAYNSYHDHDGDKHVAYSEGVFIGYRGYDKNNTEVQYPFGHGLSYTTFKLSDMKTSTQQPDGSVTVKFKLCNTGRRAGAQVVQAYIGREESSIERPEKELKQYQKIYLEPGESTTVTLTIPRSAFTYYNTAISDFDIEPGMHNISLGFSSRDIKATSSVDIK